MFTKAFNLFVVVAIAALGVSTAPLEVREATNNWDSYSYTPTPGKPAVKNPSFSSSAFNAAGTQNSDSTTIKTPNTYFHNDNANQASGWDSSSVYYDKNHYSASNAAASQQSENHNTQYADSQGNSASQHADSGSWAQSNSNVNVDASFSPANYNNKNNFFAPSSTSSSYDAVGTQSHDSTQIKTPNTYFDNSNNFAAEAYKSASAYSNKNGYGNANSNGAQWAQDSSTNYADASGNSSQQSSSSSGYNTHSDSSSTTYN